MQIGRSAWWWTSDKNGDAWAYSLKENGEEKEGQKTAECQNDGSLCQGLDFWKPNDAPTGSYGTKERFLEASLASGYKFRVTAFERTDDQARVTIKNEGVAPLYRDAYVAVNGTRGGRSLKGLLPGESATVTIPATGNLDLTIESDFTVSGRPIGYLADLN